MNTASERIRRIHESVKTIKTRKDMGVRYMQAWEEKYYIREEGLGEGIRLAKHVIKMDSIGKAIPEIAKECGVTEEIVRKILKE